MRILMVCLGNICRSPLAEGIMASKAKKYGLNWTVDSAGTGDWHVGDPPDRRSVAVAKNYGVDISNQRGRVLKLEDFDNFDRIFVMDHGNLRNVLNLTNNPEHQAKVQLMLRTLDPDDHESIVPDPYHGSVEDFEHVFHLLDRACEAFARQHIPHS